MIICFANCHTAKDQVSGGDIRFREIFKRIPPISLKIYSSRYGIDIYKKERMKAKYVQTSIVNDDMTNILGVILSYIRRTINSIKNCKKESKRCICYSISDFFPNVIPAYWMSMKKKTKWVQVIHHLYKNPFKRKGANFFTNLLGYVGQRLSFLMIRKADRIIVVNPLVKEELLGLGFSDDKIFVNPNGIELSKYDSIAPSDEKYDCSYMGRINASKGVFDLVKIWKGLVKKKPLATLAVIGKGDAKAVMKLKKEIRDEGLDNNIFLKGYLSDKDAFGILKSSKVFVFPSHEEGFGISILEAMACGLPVVTWDLEAYEHVFGDAIKIVGRWNPADFADAIYDMLNENNLNLGYKGRSKVLLKKYSWDKISQDEWKLIEE